MASSKGVTDDAPRPSLPTFEAVAALGSCAGLSQKTNVLVIGVYATESWKHSSFGNKILKTSEWRDAGLPIAIVSEKHWVRYL